MANTSEDYSQAIEKFFKISSLTDQQKLAITSALEGKDVFVSTRTGSGKSISYQAFPVIGRERCHPMSVIVISPLISIMKEQVNFLRSLGLTSTYIGDSEMDEILLKSGGYDILYGTPEALVGSSKWRDVLLGEEFQLRQTLIVIDEAHVVLEWGFSHGEETAFRGWFSNLAELRSLCCLGGRTLPMMVLTATTTTNSRKRLKKVLNMSSTTVEIVESPNRDNIKLSIIKVPASEELTVTFAWLINQVVELGDTCPRTLVFCRNKDDCGRIFSAFERTLGGNVQSLVEMFHSDTWDHIKEAISSDMQNPEGHIRVLLCTSAAGMGVNFINTHNVINFAPPLDVDTFVQQIGRVGRDGQESHALLVYHGRQLRKLEGDMLCFVRNSTECRRHLIAEIYGCQSEQNLDPLHSCCDVCQEKCSCGTEDCTASIHPSINYRVTHEEGIVLKGKCAIEDELTRVRCSTSQQRNTLNALLKDCQMLLNNELSPVMETSAFHGLTDDVIDIIVQKCDYIEKTDDLFNIFSLSSFHVAVRVFSVFLEVFGDCSYSMSDEEA